MNGRESLSYWLVVREERDRMEVLTVWLSGRGEALPVFSLEEEARIFCEREASARESGWRLRQTSTGELVSVLLGLCADVKRVALDPLSQADAGMLGNLLCVERKDFVRFLLRKRSYRHAGGGQGEAQDTPSRDRFDGQLYFDDSSPWW